MQAGCADAGVQAGCDDAFCFQLVEVGVQCDIVMAQLVPDLNAEGLDVNPQTSCHVHFGNAVVHHIGDDDGDECEGSDEEDEEAEVKAVKAVEQGRAPKPGRTSISKDFTRFVCSRH